MENLAFHSLTQMKDDYTTNSYYITCTFLFKMLRECNFLILNTSPTISSSTSSSKLLWWGSGLVRAAVRFEASWKLKTSQIQRIHVTYVETVGGMTDSDWTNLSNIQRKSYNCWVSAVHVGSSLRSEYSVCVTIKSSSYNPGQNVWDKVPFSRIAAIFARSPLPPRCNVGRLVGKPFLTNNIAWGEGGGGGGGEGRIWPKERLFPCEKLIDGRGSAFCKLVPHNFGQDCRQTS